MGAEKVKWKDMEMVKRWRGFKQSERRKIANEGIKKSKANWLGHMMRGNSILTVALEGSVEGERKKEI